MTDLNNKEKIIAIVSYLAYSVILTFQRYFPFSVVYFAAIAVTIVLADKIFAKDSIKYKTLSAFLITAVGYPTMFEIFFSVHNDLKYILTAIAAALFFACIFAFTDKKKFLLCITGAPVICCLNVKIAICYSVFLLCMSVTELYPTADSAISKKKSKKSSPDKLAIISAVISLICIGVCGFLILNDNGYIRENFDYLLLKFKNPLALLIISAYLVYRLFRSDCNRKQPIIICLVLFAASAVFATAFLGWTVFALMCTCVPLFLGLICIKDVAVINSVKSDYANNKFLFWTIIVCALQ